MDASVRHCDKNTAVFMALEAAILSGNKLWIQTILNQKPQLNCKKGGEMMWLAVVEGKVEIASMLIKAGASLNEKTPSDYRQSSYLHNVVESNNPKHYQLAMLMMENGADVNVRDIYNLTPLEYAIQARRYNVNLIKELLKHGALVTHRILLQVIRENAAELFALFFSSLFNIVNDETRSQLIDEALYAFSLVAKDKEDLFLPVVKQVLDIKLSAVQLPKARRSLLQAIYSNKVKMVKLFLEYGFDVNEPSTENGHLLYVQGCEFPASNTSLGDFPLYAAFKLPQLNIRELWSYHAADFQVTDNRGQTPLSLTSNVNAQSTLEILIKHLALLASKDEKISDDNLEIINGEHQILCYYERCLNELEKINTNKAFNNISFLFCSKKDFVQCAFRARNYNILEHVYKILRKGELSIYNEDVSYAYENIKTRATLLREKEEALSESLKNILPLIPLEKIIYYLYVDSDK